VAVGIIGADGSYAATTDGKEAIFVGDYQVTVTGPDPEISPDEAMEPDFQAPEDPIPEKYHDASTSGETVTIQDGANTYNLDMTK
jgi:hypothetical protein